MSILFSLAGCRKGANTAEPLRNPAGASNECTRTHPIHLLNIDEPGGTVYYFDIRQRRAHVLAHGLGSPRALALDDAKQILYVGSGRNVYALRTDVQNPERALYRDGFKEISGLALDGHYRLWVADSGLDSVAGPI